MLVIIAIANNTHSCLRYAYEPFTFDYDYLQKAPELKTVPTARPRSLITGKRMEKVELVLVVMLVVQTAAAGTAWANGGPFVVKYPNGDPAAKE